MKISYGKIRYSQNLAMSRNVEIYKKYTYYIISIYILDIISIIIIKNTFIQDYKMCTL